MVAMSHRMCRLLQACNALGNLKSRCRFARRNQMQGLQGLMGLACQTRCAPAHLAMTSHSRSHAVLYWGIPHERSQFDPEQSSPKLPSICHQQTSQNVVTGIADSVVRAGKACRCEIQHTGLRVK